MTAVANIEKVVEDDEGDYRDDDFPYIPLGTRCEVERCSTGAVREFLRAPVASRGH